MDWIATVREAVVAIIITGAVVGFVAGAIRLLWASGDLLRSKVRASEDEALLAKVRRLVELPSSTDEGACAQCIEMFDANDQVMINREDAGLCNSCAALVLSDVRAAVAERFEA